jgi:hypothetical protein
MHADVNTHCPWLSRGIPGQSAAGRLPGPCCGRRLPAVAIRLGGRVGAEPAARADFNAVGNHCGSEGLERRAERRLGFCSERAGYLCHRLARHHGDHCPNGTPRIRGRLHRRWLAMMAGARRVEDLRLDPRVSIHCPTRDPPAEAPGLRSDRDIAAPLRLDTLQVVLTKVASGGDYFDITSWRPGRGLRRQPRG